jgi:hypothetical protein
MENVKRRGTQSQFAPTKNMLPLRRVRPQAVLGTAIVRKWLDLGFVSNKLGVGDEGTPHVD